MAIDQCLQICCTVTVLIQCILSEFLAVLSLTLEDINSTELPFSAKLFK